MSETALATTDILVDLGKFLRPHTAEGDVIEHTLRSCFSNARQCVAWCQEQGVNPATATESEVIVCRESLVDAGYSRGTVAVKLAPAPSSLRGGVLKRAPNRQPGGGCEGTEGQDGPRAEGQDPTAGGIEIVESTAALRSAWLEVRPWMALANSVLVVVDNHTHGAILHTRAVRYRVDSYLGDLGPTREGVSCHSLRHRAVT